jgi:aminopeptidase N
VYDDEGWNVELAPAYGDATFTDTSLYQFRVTLPKEMIVATSGTIVNMHENGDGTKTYTAVSGPMRDFNIVASARYEILSATVGGVLISCYYLPGDQSGGERALDYASEALQIFGELFGDYPFSELDVMATPTLAGGIEYPGLIVVADRLYGQIGGFFEWVVVHEVAHQWWYSLVGSDQLDEPWLDEALTQYTSLLYYEHRYGETAAREVLTSAFLDPYQQLQEAREDMPAGLPVAAYPEGLYGAVVYGKGPLFFHELRAQVGDETFYGILRTYYSQYRYRVAYPRDLIAVAEVVSQKDVATLYSKWIVGD